MKEEKYDHLFHRDKGPFERITAGTKRIEVRLNDEKRQKVKIGDRIKAVLRYDENKYFISEITGLSYFKNWDDLFRAFSDKISDDDKEILKNVYTNENLEKFGILIMHFKLLVVNK